MRISVVLEALTGSFETDMNRAAKTADKRMKDIRDSAAKAGAAIGAALVAGASGFAALVRNSLNTADDMLKLSQSTGIAIEALTQLDYAAKLSGVEDLGTSLTKFNKSIAEAAQGTKTQAAAFETLGISVKDANGNLKPTEVLLTETAESLSQYEDGAAKAAMAMDLFGKTGADLIPFLNMGAKGIQELRQEADELGLTLDERTGKAAEQFNDNLSRLQGLVTGAANRAARELAPTLALVTNRMVEAGKQGGGLNTAFRALDYTMRTLIAGGAVIGEVFNFLGKSLGSVAASIVAASEGEWSRAKNILTSAGKDIVSSVKDTTKFVNDLYSGAANAIKPVVEETEKVTQKTLKYASASNESAKAVKSQEKALKDFTSALKEYNSELLEAEDTALEPARARQDIRDSLLTPLEEYQRRIKELNDPELNLRAVDPETYRRAIEDAQERFSEASDSIARDFGRIEEETANVYEHMEEFGKRAAQNIQDSFADFLFNPFDDGLKGMLKSFGDTLRRMAAEQLSNAILSSVFNLAANAFTGFTNPAAGLPGLSTPIGGPRDAGGRGSAGTAYMIGAGAQPEMFIPDTAGTFVPKNQWQQGMNVVQNFNIQAPQGTISRQTQQQIGAAASRGLATASRRNN